MARRATPSSAEALLDCLRGGDRRSIGRVAEAVDAVLADRSLTRALVAGLDSTDPLVQMRAADALEKVTVRHPDWLAPHKSTLLRGAARYEAPELRWHAAQMLPRLPLTPSERRAAARILRRYLDGPGSIVRTFALQGLADLAVQDARLRREVLALAEAAARDGTPAMRSRARTLLRRLRRDAAPPARLSSRARRAPPPR